MPPAFRHGKNTQFLIGTVGATLGPLINISTMCKDTNFPRPVDMAETTAFLSTNKSFVPGIPDATFAFSGQYSSGANDVDTILSALLGFDTSPVGAMYAPEGLVAGRVRYSFCHYLKNYTVHAAVHDIVSFTAELQIVGSGTPVGASNTTLASVAVGGAPTRDTWN